MLCLPAVAQKKSSSKSSSKSSVATSSYSGGSRASSAPVHQKGKFGITGDLGLDFGSVTTVVLDATNTPVQTTRPNNQTSFGIAAGVSYFVLDRLEIGGSLGFNNVRTDQGPDPNDVNNKQRLYQDAGTFSIVPYVAYHLPITNWLHYAPAFQLGLGFGYVNTDITYFPQRQFNPASSLSFNATVNLLRFELLANSHFSFLMMLGDMTFSTTSVKDFLGPGTSRTNTNFTLNVFGNFRLGARYYF